MRIKPVDCLLYVAMKLLKAVDKRQTDLKHFDAGKIKNILVVSSTAIGDTLLSTPAIRSVRQKYPYAKIIAHFNIKNMALFENNPDIDEIVPYYGGYKKIFSTIREFRRHNFDLALIFHGNEPQTTPMAYLSKARFIIKLPNTSEYRFLLSNQQDRLNWHDFPHAIEQRLSVSRLAGCGEADKRMLVYGAAEGKNYIDNYLAARGITPQHVLIGFQVGASTLSRMWLPDRFVALGKKIIEACPRACLIITGSPLERGYCEGIARGIGDNTLVTAGEVPLKFMPSLLRRMRTLLTGDTGIMHLAVAVGTPVIALFAVADARLSGPYYDSDKHAIIQKERTCDPCSSKKCGYQKCMEQITVKEVFDLLSNRVRLDNINETESAFETEVV